MGPNMKLPYEIKLGKGKTKVVNIPLVRVCKARDIVFEDKNQDGKKDEDEQGLPLIRLLLTDVTGASRETFSDNNGRYSFAGVLPGAYELKIDTQWFPARYKLTTQPSYALDLKPADEIDNLDFGGAEKERAIIKTYTTTPEAETIYPEKKE
jgi:hypothetical protein